MDRISEKKRLKENDMMEIKGMKREKIERYSFDFYIDTNKELFIYLKYLDYGRGIGL